MTVFQGNIAQPHITVPGRGAVFGTVPLKVRFWAKVKKTKMCWNWISSLDGNGRGQISVNGRQRRASRVSWEMHKGKIPRGLHVLHKCDNKLCIRPSHLFLGTHADNMADMVKKGRQGFVPTKLKKARLKPATRRALSKKISGYRWITNGLKNSRIDKDAPMPRGFRYGKLSHKKRKYPLWFRATGYRNYKSTKKIHLDLITGVK